MIDLVTLAAADAREEAWRLTPAARRVSERRIAAAEERRDLARLYREADRIDANLSRHRRSP